MEKCDKYAQNSNAFWIMWLKETSTIRVNLEFTIAICFEIISSTEQRLLRCYYVGNLKRLYL